MVSYPTYITENAFHKYVEKLDIQKDCYNILISQFGNDSINNNQKSNISLNDIEIHYHYNDIRLIDKLISETNELENKPIQILIQLGKDAEVLIKNNINKKMFSTNYRKTYQIESDLLNGTYDQNGIKVHIPTVEDTVRLLNKYYYNRELIKIDGKKCRNEILTKLSPKKVVNDLINILKN